MAGVTFSQPGNWTSWPPHEHAVLAEEAYLFIDMPRPAFGVQLVYVDDVNPELATIVREGDVVLMPQGYHPNVAAPGHPINFLWMMAAEREQEDRLFGVVNVHPDFASGGSGIERGRARWTTSACRFSIASGSTAVQRSSPAPHAGLVPPWRARWRRQAPTSRSTPAITPTPTARAISPRRAACASSHLPPTWPNARRRLDWSRRLPAALGRIDILVNNAGIIRRADALEYSDADWDEVLMVDLSNVFRLCRAAARDMLARRSGKIINIASMLSFQGGTRVPAYAAAKGGVAQLTKALANEWAPRGVNVNAIAPGYMRTDNTQALRDDRPRYDAITARIPAGRWGEPEDLAGAVVFLASQASDYVHGYILAVDGGWLAR